MTRILLPSIILTGLLFTIPHPVSAQMMGGMMSGRRMAQTHSAQAGQNGQSMHAMMHEMDGMMLQMRGMMQGRGTKEHQGMPMTGMQKSGDNWGGMMQSMNAMGANMEQMLSKMDRVMSNKSLMANPKISSNMKALRKHMGFMMNSMRDMLQNMREMRTPGPALK